LVDWVEPRVDYLSMKEILKIDDLAKWLDCSHDVIRDMVKANKIPHFRVGRLIRFHRASVLEWASAGLKKHK
jgi:excisionase family DNA binding protein